LNNKKIKIHIFWWIRNVQSAHMALEAPNEAENIRELLVKSSELLSLLQKHEFLLKYMNILYILI